jgi:ubiquinone/menaquinone biosynthesis C-methylase UbiE
MTDQIRFDDGAAYQRYMGVWSQLVGAVFLDWLAPPPGARWLDVGCGNGAFTEMIVERCAPAAVEGIDPSEGQLAYARSGPAARVARFQVGDAMAVPFADAVFDVAVMPLVIFFVPEPARGVAEMARVVRPGGTVTAYGWDMRGGGFPYHALQAELRAMGVPVPAPPHPEAADLAVLRELWVGAGLVAVETHEIIVRRAFASADDYWQAARGGPSIGRQLREMPAERLAALQERMREHLAPDAAGRIVCTARANAVRGRVPAG